MPDPTISGPSSSLSDDLQADDILDILNDETPSKEEKEEDKEEKEVKASSEDDDEDDEEDKKDRNEEDEEEDKEGELEYQLEDKEPMMEPASRKKILAKYPNLFKDFPWLEHAHYRNNEFSQIFSTVEEAKEAADRIQAFSHLENSLMDGDSKDLLKQIKDVNPDGFYKLVDNYLTNLGQVDKEAYYHVLSNVTRSTIQAMINKAGKEDNKALKAAATILNQFIFGDQEIVPPSKLSREEPKDDSVKKERAEFIKEQFSTVSNELYTETTNLIKANIEANIDPNKKMSPYVKKNAVKDAIAAMERIIGSDKGFRTGLDRLWERALQNKFSRESKNSIKSAYLHRAKSILPEVIKSARREALRGTGHREEKDRKGPLGIGRSSSNNRGKESPRESAKKIPPGMSTLDYLNSD